MAVFGSSPRNDSSPIPLLAALLLAVANLAVFWLELYKILVAANLGIALMLLAFEILMPSSRRRNWSVTLIFLALYGYVVLACSWAPVPSEAYENAGRTLAAALPAFFAGEYLARRYDLGKILTALCCMSLIFLPQLFFNAIQNEDPSLIGEFSVRTVLGTMFAVIVPISVGMYLKVKKWFFLFTGLISFAAVILLQSRAGILISPATTLFLIYIHNNKLGRNLLVFGGIPLILIASLTFSGDLGRFTSIDTNVSVNKEIFAEFAIDRSLRVDFDRRLHTYMAGEMFSNSPFFGDGYFSMSQNNRFNFGINLTAHGYPGFLAELGLVGIMLFVLFLYFGLRDFIRSAQTDPTGRMTISDRSFLAGFAAILLAGFFHQQLESGFFALMAGILAGLGSPLKTRMNVARPQKQELWAF